MTKLFARTFRDMPTLQVATGRDLAGGHPTERMGELPNGKPSANEEGRSPVDEPKLRELVKIDQLIDLTDEPISLTRDDICWSGVRASASNCICCCNNNSITLVTTDESYVLDHIPLDNIRACQANPSLEYLALANDEHLAVIDLIESNGHTTTPLPHPAAAAASRRHTLGEPRVSTKLVDLASVGASMRAILFWRWLDANTLALVSSEALYTCPVDRTFISHPAMTALGRAPTRLLPLERVCGLYHDLGGLSQITNVQRAASMTLYAISGLSRQQHTPPSSTTTGRFARPRHKQVVANGVQREGSSQQVCDTNDELRKPAHSLLSHTFPGTKLRLGSISVPSRLSMLAGDEPASIKPENSLAVESFRRATRVAHKSNGAQPLRVPCSGQTQPPARHEHEHNDDSCQTILGNTQIYCKLRDCSQLIKAHAVAFATVTDDDDDDEQATDPSTGGRERNEDAAPRVARTTLIAANLSGDKLTVNFIGMATSSDLSTSGLSASRCLEFEPRDLDAGGMNFPTWIVCSQLRPGDERSRAALILTKFGRLIVCSIVRASILFHVQVASDTICSVTLEDKSQGAMVVCRNGRVLLVRLDAEIFRQASLPGDLAGTPRYGLPPHSIQSGSLGKANCANNGAAHNGSAPIQEARRRAPDDERSDVHEVIISTKL